MQRGFPKIIDCFLRMLNTSAAFVIFVAYHANLENALTMRNIWLYLFLVEENGPR